MKLQESKIYRLIEEHYVISLIIITIISAAFHLPHFPKDIISIHAWRQTQTQSNIVNFYEEDMNVLNPHRNDRGDGLGIFRMELPLMQWMTAVLYKVFGNHIIITRIFMFVIGVFSVFGMFVMINAVFKNRIAALIGAWALTFSPSFYYYTINPMPDNLALCCSIWGLGLFFIWVRDQKLYKLILGGIFLSVGVLCKLPFILYYIVPAVYFGIQFFKNGEKRKAFAHLSIYSCFILFPLAWYLSVISQWKGNGIVGGVINSTIPVSKTLKFIYFNFVSTLPELLLNYGSVLFFLSAFYFIVKRKEFKKPLFVLFAAWGFSAIAYYLFESNMIATIHDYYLFPFLPILFLLVGYGAYNLLNSNNKFVRYIAVFMILVLPLSAYGRMLVRWNPDLPGLNKDLLVYKADLRSAVPKNALVIAGNDESHYIFFYYIDKKGWGFNDDALNSNNMKDMINRGAKYMYSDSRNMDTNKVIVPFLDSLIMERGTVKVFKLRGN